MTGEPKPGKIILKEPDVVEYNALKLRLSNNPDSDVREAYLIITRLEENFKFLREEFDTVMQDYNLEVYRNNKLRQIYKVKK